MDPENISSAQDVYSCGVCNIPACSLMHCDVCHVNLCKGCVGEHLFDQSIEHKVVAFEKRGSTANVPKCQKHSKKLCELQCNRCEIPICLNCITQHEGHAYSILSSRVGTTKILQDDLHELEKEILPKYQEAEKKILSQRNDLCMQFQALKAGIKIQGEGLHKKIDEIILEMQSKVNGYESQRLETIDKVKNNISQRIRQITEVIKSQRELLRRKLYTNYKSNILNLRKLPLELKVSMPTFTPKEIKREKIYKLFGSLADLAFDLRDGSLRNVRPFLDEPKILSGITTETSVHTVSCVKDGTFWTCGENKVIEHYNSQRKLKSLERKAAKEDIHIAVTLTGDLVVTGLNEIGRLCQSSGDLGDLNYKRGRYIYNETFKGTAQVKLLIKLSESTPQSICSTSFGDLLVIMTNNDKNQTKVVRYSGSTEMQCIQWDDQWLPLYSSGVEPDVKYITENRNMDVCVADNRAHAVVVVNAAGKLRFRYTSPTPPTNKQFDPYGITTDSQGMILIADTSNHRIHILDENGQFLRYIYGWNMRSPKGLCVDSNDNLLVAMCNSLQKIQYYQTLHCTLTKQYL